MKPKTVRIYHKRGLYFAIVHYVRKKTRRVYDHLSAPFIFFYRICKRFHLGFYLTLRKLHVFIEHPATFDFIAKHYGQICEWIESQSFKDMYANHPYPPLLNPDDIDYESIPAIVAWECNLPLPSHFLFLNFGSHGCGNRGLEQFLKYCGGFAYRNAPWHPSFKSWAQGSYICAYDEILHTHRYIVKNHLQKRYFGYFLARDLLIDKKFCKKFFALIPHKKALLLVRDPISMLKTFMSFPYLTHYQVSFSQSSEDICPSIASYFVGTKRTWFHRIAQRESTPKLSVNGCEARLRDEVTNFHDMQMMELLSHYQLSDVTCIDMSEIVGEKAFETMQRLSETFGFPAPNPNDKARFSQKIGFYEGLLPLVFDARAFGLMMKICVIDKAFCTQHRIYFSSQVAFEKIGSYIHLDAFERYLDITAFLFNVEHFYGRIGIVIEKKDFETLRQNKEAIERIKAYFLDFIPRLEAQRKIEDSKRFSEEDVLLFLKNHKHIRKKFKKRLDKHLALIKTLRPDIVASWKHYQAFENLCTS